jgi:hypothetical protein
MDLVACLGTGKGTWIQVSQLIKNGNWGKVYLLTNEFGKENFTKDEKTSLVVVDDRKEMEEVRNDMINQLKPLIKSPEVAVNMVSGAGKEHMALITALLKMGLCIRFYSMKGSEVVEV